MSNPYEALTTDELIAAVAGTTNHCADLVGNRLSRLQLGQGESVANNVVRRVAENEEIDDGADVIEDLTAQLAKRDSELEELRTEKDARISELYDKLHDAEVRIQLKTREVKSLTTRVEVYEGLVVRAHVDIEAAKKNATAKDGAISALKEDVVNAKSAAKEVDVLNGKIDTLERLISDLDLEVESSRAELKDAGRLIAEKESEVACCRDNLKQANSTLGKISQELDGLNRRVKSLESLVVCKDMEIERSWQIFEVSGNKLKMKSAEIKGLKRQLRKMEAGRYVVAVQRGEDKVAIKSMQMKVNDQAQYIKELEESMLSGEWEKRPASSGKRANEFWEYGFEHGVEKTSNQDSDGYHRSWPERKIRRLGG